MKIQRFIKLTTRIYRAYQYGIEFRRVATFRRSESVQVGGRRLNLMLPSDHDIELIQLEIFLDDCYQLWRFKNQNIHTVLDIGGNVGLFSVAARAKFANAQIHTYEPNQDLIAYLSHQATVANFHYFAQAVGPTTGHCKLIMGEAAGLTQSIFNDDLGSIPQISIKEAIQGIGGQVDLVKMDIEGSEWDILEVFDAWQAVRHLVMEYHLCRRVNTVKEAMTKVENLGFTILHQEPIYENSTGIIIATRKPESVVSLGKL